MKNLVLNKKGIIVGIAAAVAIAFGFLLGALTDTKPAPVPAKVPASAISLGGAVSSVSGVGAPQPKTDLGIWVVGCSSYETVCSAPTPVLRSLEDLRDNPRALRIARDANALATCGRVPSWGLLKV